MKCKHQFHLIKQTRKVTTRGNTTSTMPNTNIIAERWDDHYGAMVGCSECGEIRTIWEDGTIDVNSEQHFTGNKDLIKNEGSTSNT